MYYVNNGMQLLNIHNVFRDNSLVRLIPIDRQNLNKVVTVFKYDPPISTMLCNYSRELRQVNKDSLQMVPKFCKCTNSKFVYPSASHIITGNLELVKSNSLRTLFGKGAKFRPPKPVNWTEVYCAVMEAVEGYIDFLIYKHKIQITDLLPFKERFMHILRSRIHWAKQNYQHCPSLFGIREKVALKNLIVNL